MNLPQLLLLDYFKLLLGQSRMSKSNIVEGTKIQSHNSESQCLR